MFPVQNQTTVDSQAGRLRAPAGEIGIYWPKGIEIRPERMLRIMGYREGGPVRPAVQRVASAMAELAMSAMAPVVHDCRVAIERCGDDGLLLADGTFFHGPVFAKHMAGCGTAVAFILTLGSRFDSTEKNLVTGGNMLEAVFLETAGWVAVEEVTRLYTGALSQTAGTAALTLTRRLAPGYAFRVGGRKVAWPLEDQKPFFGLFAGVTLPVELLDSCAMTPKMSRTGFYGLRRRADRTIAPGKGEKSPGADS